MKNKKKKTFSRKPHGAPSRPRTDTQTVRPLRDQVLIEPLKQEEKTASGIYLPQTAEKERPEQGRVIAVGAGRVDSKGELIRPSVKKGDRVLFSKYGPTEIKVNGKEYLMVKEEEILAVLE